MAAAAGGRTIVGLLAAVAVMAGTGLAQERLGRLSHDPLEGLTGRAVSARAVLVEAPRPRPHGGATARVRWLGGPTPGDVALARLPARRSAAGTSSAQPGAAWPEVGTVLELVGRIAPLAPWEAFQQRRGAHAAVNVSRMAVTDQRRGGLAGALDAARDRARGGLQGGLPADEAAVLRGMVLGEDQAIGDDVRREFERSGLAHLLAVSGQNVMLLAALVLAAGALVELPCDFGWRRRWAWSSSTCRWRAAARRSSARG